MNAFTRFVPKQIHSYMLPLELTKTLNMFTREDALPRKQSEPSLKGLPSHACCFSENSFLSEFKGISGEMLSAWIGSTHSLLACMRERF